MTTRTTLLSAGLLLSPVLATHSSAALIAGDIAIIGYTDNGAPDSFVVTTLAPLTAGEIIYFTDNGWTGSGFRNTNGPTDGDGNETLIALTIDAAIPAGTVLTSAVSISGSVTWTASGAIPGTSTGNFAPLAFATGGDQITAFQGPTSNPLASPTVNLYLMHNGAGFTAATNTNDTAIPTGLSIAAGTVAHLPPTPSPDFLSGTFRLDGTDPDVANLQTNGGTQAQWLSVISDRDNWLENAAALASLNVLPVPEPGSSALAALAAGLLLRRRR